VDEEGNSVWVMRSKNARGKLMLNPKKKTITYSYESNEQRYVKIFVFNLTAQKNRSTSSSNHFLNSGITVFL
jgi:hypothetical protein